MWHYPFWVCTKAENNGNKINNTSGYTGVSWNKRQNKWMARITHQYKDVFLGYFTEKEAAIKSRQEAEQKYFNI